MISWSEISIRLCLAAFLGALIGIERERKHWTAGLRTHMMVCVGACLVIIVSAYGFHDILGQKNVTLDPSRIAAQVVSGIGFIGAGTILLLKEGTIRGLTTASGLWTVAAIGLATGGGLYFGAVVTTSIALVILWGLQPLEQFLFKKFEQKTLRILTTQNANNSILFNDILNHSVLKVQSFSFEKTNDGIVYILRFENSNSELINSYFNEIKDKEGVKEVSWS